MRKTDLDSSVVPGPELLSAELPTPAGVQMRRLKFRTLIERRRRTGWWTLLYWLFPYSFTAVMLVREVTSQRHAGLAEFWPLLLPVGIILLQWYRPTIFGWSLIVLPTLVCACAAVFYTIRNWEFNPARKFFGFHYFAVDCLLWSVLLLIAVYGWPASLSEAGDA